MKTQPNILLLGIGSIGGIIASKLLQAKLNCTLITSNESITYNIAKNGLVVSDSSEKDQTRVYPKKIFTTVDFIEEKFDYIFYMMKATKIQQAIYQTKHLLASEGKVVTFQNGLVYDFFANSFAQKIITASVVFNSVMNKPGIYTVSKFEKIIIGSIDNDRIGKDLLKLKEILNNVTDCEISGNILGLSWSKLAINCSINAITAVTGTNLGVVLRKKFGKEMFFAIYKETVDVATKLGIQLENIKIDPYLLYQDDKTPFHKKCIQLILIKQIGKKYSSIYPSMLQDVKKGKKTEIDFLNGYVTALGKYLNIPTPANAEMTSLIKKIELRYLKPDISLLKIACEMPNLNKTLNNSITSTKA